MPLQNKVNRKELKQKIREQKDGRRIISFYKYTRIDSPIDTRNCLYKIFSAAHILGRIYVAHEGINAQISIPIEKENQLNHLLEKAHPSFKHIRLNKSIDERAYAFPLLTIKVRLRIVSDGIEDSASFDVQNNGKYVTPKEVEKLYEEKDTIIVDMRNHYEYEVGHFESAFYIPSDTFRDQLPRAIEMLKPHKKQKIMLYCTGGIRCEKASAWLKHHQFEHVYHLQGGIINYANHLNENKNVKSKFIGKNFVFDDRLGERISKDIIAYCHQCGESCDTHTNCNNEGCHLLFIQCTSCAKKYEGCCSSACRATYRQPENMRKTLRKGKKNGRNIFNKSTQALSQKFPNYKLLTSSH